MKKIHFLVYLKNMKLVVFYIGIYSDHLNLEKPLLNLNIILYYVYFIEVEFIKIKNNIMYLVLLPIIFLKNYKN